MEDVFDCEIIDFHCDDTIFALRFGRLDVTAVIGCVREGRKIQAKGDAKAIFAR
jgi:hypothetical protein